MSEFLDVHVVFACVNNTGRSKDAWKCCVGEVRYEHLYCMQSNISYTQTRTDTSHQITHHTSQRQNMNLNKNQLLQQASKTERKKEVHRKKATYKY